MTTSPTSELSGASVDLLLPTWMERTVLEGIWRDAYIETGDANLAMESVRRSSEYDQYFAGNRRDDGSLRYDEGTYLSIIESYEDELLAVNVNPDLYRGRFPELISGLVSPAEFTTRVESMYERVIESAPEIRDFYATNFGLDMSDSAIVASFLDPDIGQAVLDKRIAISEIGGEAATRGFDVSKVYAESLERTDMTRREAQGFFGEAATMIPALGVLAARHADPDDSFDLGEFTSATLFDDPEQRKRMRRLIAQEASTFTGGSQVDYVRGQMGVAGLEQR